MLTLPLFRRYPFNRRQRPANGVYLARSEVFAICVLGQLAPHHLIEINHGDGYLGPSQLATGDQAAPASDQSSVRRYDNRVKQSDAGDASRETVDITHRATMPVANFNSVDMHDFPLHVVEPPRGTARCGTGRVVFNPR